VSEPAEVFDPRGLLAALDRNYVGYVLIGGLARVIRGTDELTSGVDICPGLRFENVDRLARALEELEARRADRRRLVVDEDTLAQEAVLELRTNRGGLKVVAEPAGTRRGYEDLRKAATREHIGEGLRPRVASVADLARMSAAMAHERELQEPGGRVSARELERMRELEIEHSRELRRILEVEMSMQRSLGIERDIGIDM
jgi:hypothetical protein